MMRPMKITLNLTMPSSQKDNARKEKAYARIAAPGRRKAYEILITLFHKLRGIK